MEKNDVKQIMLNAELESVEVRGTHTYLSYFNEGLDYSFELEISTAELLHFMFHYIDEIIDVNLTTHSKNTKIKQNVGIKRILGFQFIRVDGKLHWFKVDTYDHLPVLLPDALYKFAREIKEDEKKDEEPKPNESNVPITEED